MSEPKSNRRAIAVGVFIIVGLLFLVGGVLTIGNLHSTFQKKMTVSTVFSDVGGLTAGNNIWFSGVKVGTVKKLEFYGESQVRVIMNINAESRQYIRKDAKVKLSTDGLIGNKILVIYGGTHEAGAVAQGDMLKNESSLSTEDIMLTLQKNNINILALTEKLANGEGTIGKLLTSDAIYNDMAATSASLKITMANAQLMTARLTQDLTAYTANLNKEGTLAHDLVTDTTVFNSLKSSVAQLQTVADNAAATVKDLKDAAANPNSPMGVLLRDEKAGAQLKATISNLEKTSVTLNKDLEALQHSILLRRGIRKEAKKAEEQEAP